MDFSLNTHIHMKMPTCLTSVKVLFHLSIFACVKAVMLDEFGGEMDHAESRVDTTVKKIAKVLHLSNGNLNNHCNRSNV